MTKLQTAQIVEKPPMPELLRVKVALLLSTQSTNDAEACLVLSIDKSGEMGANAGELRTSTDLAALWIADERLHDARLLSKPMSERETADVIVAKDLLAAGGQ